MDFRDDLYIQAKKIVVENQKATASLLQRELKIGYAKSAMYLDMMEEEGVVGSFDFPRKVLIKRLKR